MTGRWNRVSAAALCGMLLALVMPLGGCERAPADKSASVAGAAERPQVYVTFHPTEYWAQRIGGDFIEVVNPLPVDADAADWMPAPEVIRAYQQAALIVVNGADFEGWIEKVSLPEARIVNTARPLADDFITLTDAVTHSHGPGGEHTHEGTDGHTWLDPVNAKMQADEIRAALSRRFPQQADQFEANHAALVVDLDALDARLRAVSERLGDQPLACNHPAYNYLARRYGWNLETFYLEPDVTPSAEELAKLREFALAQRPRLLLWESQPDAALAARLTEELGLQHVVFAPCENPGEAERAAGANYLSLMHDNVDRLEQALGD